MLEKITDLAGLVSGGGAEVEDLLQSAVTRKDDVIAKKMLFSKSCGWLCQNVMSRQTS